MNDQPRKISRRGFVAASLSVAAAPLAGFNSPRPAPTIASVIEAITAGIALSGSTTVDTVKYGDASREVKGIVTTMFATVDVIRKAAALGANFIIAHEPVFYNHADETAWLAGDDIYTKKTALMDQSGMVVWRCHDYLHANRPDGVLQGVMGKLQWKDFQDKANPIIFNIPVIAFGDLIAHCKRALGIEQLRYIGERQSSCRKVALMPGAWGGRPHMQVLREHRPDVLLCGELQEWETTEYIRDANALGIDTKLVVLGHAVSEEPGMEWMVEWLRPKVPGVKMTHIPSGNPLSFA